MTEMDRDVSYVSWVSPDGEHIPLSGWHRDDINGVWLGGEPKNLSTVATKAIFEAAARQRGETWVGETMDHNEIDLPLFILAADGPDLRLRREHLKLAMPTSREGWLVVGSSVTGLRWVAARRREMVPLYAKDVDLSTGLRVDVVLSVDYPLARTANVDRQWNNTTGAATASGSVWVDPGPAFEAWAEFTFCGPGRPRIRYQNVDFDLGFDVLAGEKVIIVTDQARPTVRGITADGKRRNLLPLLKGKKFSAPILPGEVVRVDVSVTGASAATAMLASVPVSWEGLL